MYTAQAKKSGKKNIEKVAFLTEVRASRALLLGIGFMMLGNGLQGTLLGVRATLEGFDTFTTGIGLSIGPITLSYFMSLLCPDAFFAGISAYFAMIVLAVLSSMGRRDISAQDVEEQAPILASGPIRSPVAAFVAPDAEDYVQAWQEDELEPLDEQETQAPIAGPDEAYVEDVDYTEEDHY